MVVLIRSLNFFKNFPTSSIVRQSSSIIKGRFHSRGGGKMAEKPHFLEKRLRFYNSPDELAAFQAELLPFEDLTIITSSIQIHRLNCMPQIGMHLYSFDGDAGGKYVICLKESKPRDYQVYLGCTADEVVPEEFELGFSQFLAECPVMNSIIEGGEIMTCGQEKLVETADYNLRNIGFNLNRSTPSILFAYRDILHRLPSSNLPDGYTLDTIRDDDAPYIASTWKYSQENEVEVIRQRLRGLPTVCIRHEGKPTAFVSAEHNGFLMHLYVVPEHRGKRLQRVALDQLAYEMNKRLGIAPMYCVEAKNTTMLKTIKREHEVLDRRGNPVVDIYNEYVYAKL